MLDMQTNYCMKSTLKSPKLSVFYCLNVFVRSLKHNGRAQAAQHIHAI